MDELKKYGFCEARNKCFSLNFIEKLSYIDEDGVLHTTFKDVVRDYICPNYGFDGQYGEY